MDIYMWTSKSKNLNLKWSLSMHCLLPGGAATAVLLKMGETNNMGLASPNHLCV